jgi:hypothetical protein
MRIFFYTYLVAFFFIFLFIQLFYLINCFVLSFQSKWFLSRLLSILFCFETSQFNLLVLKGCGTLVINGLLIFFISLSFSLKNLYKIIIKSIIFKLCLLVIVYSLGLLGINMVYFPLVLCCLVLWSFNVSKQKTLYIINFFFLIFFWSLVYNFYSLYTLNYDVKDFENTVYILTLFNNYYDETMNPLEDLYSNVNPNEYIETLKYLENLIRDLFKQNSNNPDPQFILLNHDSDEDNNDDGDNLLDIFINIPDKYLEEAVYKEPYGYHVREFDNLVYSNNIEKYLNFNNISLDELNGFINNHNNLLDYSNKYLDKLQGIKNKWEGDTLAKDLVFSGWNLSYIIDKLRESTEEGKDIDIDTFLRYVKVSTLSSLQDYNLALGGFYYYTSEDSSKLSLESKKCFYYIKSRNCVIISHCLDTLIDNQILLDRDLYPERIEYIKNYFDDSKTYEEIGDNLLCTGISTLFWCSLEQFMLECKEKNPNITFEDISLELQDFSEIIFEDEPFKALLNLYKENSLKYEIETKVEGFDYAMSHSRVRFSILPGIENIFKEISSYNHFNNDNYNAEDNMSPLSYLYGNSCLWIHKFPTINYIYGCLFKLPANIPLSEQTEVEIKDLDPYNPINIPLPEVTKEEEEFFSEECSNILSEEQFLNNDQSSIGEEFLYESLEGDFFPKGF